MTKPPRRFDDIPEALRLRPQWVCSRMPDKVSVTPTGASASSTNPATWSAYEVCRRAATEHGWGIAFVFTDADPFAVIDLDHVRNAETGETEPWAQAIIDELSSYTEVSWSGTGWHIIVQGGLTGQGNKRGRVEAYDRRKVMTLTGETVLGFGSDVVEQRDLTGFQTRLVEGKLDPNSNPASNASSTPSTGDESKDEFALACRIARQCSADFEKTKAEFLKQATSRPKLQRADYVDRTIRNAITRVLTSQPLVEERSVQPPAEWRTAFRDPAMLQSGEVRMLIKGILPEGVTLFGSNSGVGKTWLAVSALKALISAQPYLGVFEVPEPQKVLYLVPEVGDRSLRYRLERLRVPLDGTRFRVRTLADGVLRLNDPLLLQAVNEWNPVVFLDTAVRFANVKDENSAAENATLADALFSLIKSGARGVVGLHHSPKGTAKADELTLENVLRGTGDLGAMCDAVWGLQHDRGRHGEGEEYVEESRNLTRLFVKCVKPRDFEPADPFRVQGRPYIDEQGDFVVLTGENETGAVPTNKASRAAHAVAENPKVSKNTLARMLGVSRNSIEEILATQGWRYQETSKTSGLWVSTEKSKGLDFASA